MGVKLTIVFGYRNREVERVKRCLDSLSVQSESNFNVVFVDYGSEFPKADQIKELVSSYSFCRYIYNDTRGMPWNRAHALNSGILMSEGKFTMTSDIDLIFSKHFIKEILANVNEHVELHANAFALPKKFKAWDSLPNRSKLNFSSRDLTALGLVQVVLTSALKEVRGFDEYYRIWGAEDEDLNQRLVKMGLVTKWLDLEYVPVFHQWHASSGFRTKKSIPNGWQKNLSHYLRSNIGTVKRNSEQKWGKIFTADSRKSFLYLRSKSFNKDLLFEGTPVFQAVHEIYQAFQMLNSGQSLQIVYSDDRLSELKKSSLYKLINKFNQLSNRYKWPLLLTNDLSYFGNYNTTYDFRDMIMYFLLNKGNDLEDYFMECNEMYFRLILIKE